MAVIESEVWQIKAEKQFIEAIYAFSEKTGMSLRTLAKIVHVDPSYFSKVKAGIIHYSSELDGALSRVHWMLSLAVLERVSGGVIINPLRIDPEMDTSPSGLKERLSKNLEEVTNALKNLRAYQKNPDREAVIETMYQMLDVMIDSNVTFGVYREQFGIDQKEFMEGYIGHRREEEGK